MDHAANPRADALFERYGVAHQHPTNKAIHWVCVPVIMWSLLALLWTLSPWVAYGFVAFALAYYLWLSIPLAIGMLAIVALMLSPMSTLGRWLLPLALAAFVAAWVGQFAGHRIEGRKPSFLEDVRSFLIGPAWLLRDIYRRFGIAY